MRINIDIPDWCDERHIRIMAGIEMVAYRLQGEDQFKVKTARCVMCGNCCVGLSKRHPTALANGDCMYLDPLEGGQRLCSLKADRPFECGGGLQQMGRIAGCSVEYKEI